MPEKAHTTGAGSPKPAVELLDMYYLHLRSALLETAAGLDRIQRAPGGGATSKDPRFMKLQQACAVLAGESADRAERFQHLLSDS